MTKRLTQLFSVLLLALFLTACGGNNADDNNADDNSQDNSDQEEMADNGDDDTDDSDTNDGDMNNTNDNTSDNANNTTDNNQTNSDQNMIDKMGKLDYAEFEMEADYGNNNEYAAEIEQDKNKNMIESDLEDEVNDNVDTMGQEAFDKIYPNVKKLTIDRDTSKQDAIDETLKAFSLDSDYKEFEMEITFQDGTKLAFEDK
ncbi:hypothetical protein GCM10028778_24080 [Barrientosiimonas marina]|uniref:YusW family protein n=1 Tax=Lentibacillus kimchii TaxID=1542911 RepID=A0ABW2V001_9BACI